MLRHLTLTAAMVVLTSVDRLSADDLIERRDDCYIVTVAGEWSGEHAVAVETANQRLRQSIRSLIDPLNAAGSEAASYADRLAQAAPLTLNLEQRPLGDFTLHRLTIVARIDDREVEVAKRKSQATAGRRQLTATIFLLIAPLLVVLLVLGLRGLDRWTLGDQRQLLLIAILGLLFTIGSIVWLALEYV